MTNFSAHIPVAKVGAANAELEAQGFGPNNFSVPVASAGAVGADFAALHTWSHDAFRAAVEALDAAYGVVITDGAGTPNLAEACTKAALTWVPYSGDNAALPMKGATTSYAGKTWTNLSDKNAFAPPIGWREVPPQGQLPSWAQPVSSIDAYPIDFKVTHIGKDWQSTVKDCVWEPSVFGWKDISVVVDEWPLFVQPTHAGNVYAKDAKVTFESKHYQSLINSNSWSPTAYAAGWILRP